MIDRKLDRLDIQEQFIHEDRDRPYLYTAPHSMYAAFFDGSEDSMDAVQYLHSILPSSWLTLQLFSDGFSFLPGLTITADLLEPFQSEADRPYSLVLLSSDRILVNKTIPDLSRICSDDFQSVFDFAKRHAFTVTSNVFCLVRQIFVHDGVIGADLCGGVCYAAEA